MTLRRCPLSIVGSRGTPPREVPRVCGPSEPTNFETITGTILYEMCFNLKLSGDEVYYTT